MRSAEIETALRECLRRCAAISPPPPQALADAIIKRARVVRQRQAGAGALALVTVIAAAGVWSLRPTVAAPVSAQRFVAQDSASPALATASPTRPAVADVSAPLPGSIRQDRLRDQVLPVDVVVVDRLLTSGGTVDLSQVGSVTEAYQVTDGWLVLGLRRAGDSSLWFVRRDGALHQLVGGAESITVAPSGDRVAWREGTELHLGTMARGLLSPVEDAPAPAGVLPAGFVGDGVLLARHPTEALRGSYAVWRPGQGELDPAWRTAIEVYGALPDGRTVLAQVEAGDGAPCLARLDALAGLAVRAQACDVPLTAGATGWLSPDGRWLVAEQPPAKSVVVDVNGAFDGMGEEAAVGVGLRFSGPGAWTDDSTVVYGADGQLTRLHLDRALKGRADAVVRITLRGATDRSVLAVATLPATSP